MGPLLSHQSELSVNHTRGQLGLPPLGCSTRTKRHGRSSHDMHTVQGAYTASKSSDGHMEARQSGSRAHHGEKGQLQGGIEGSMVHSLHIGLLTAYTRRPLNTARDYHGCRRGRSSRCPVCKQGSRDQHGTAEGCILCRGTCFVELDRRPRSHPTGMPKRRDPETSNRRVGSDMRH